MFQYYTELAALHSEHLASQYCSSNLQACRVSFASQVLRLLILCTKESGKYVLNFGSIIKILAHQSDCLHHFPCF